MVEIDHRLCDGCGQCVSACPFGAITMVDGSPIIGPGCTGCGSCEEACPRGAIGTHGGSGKVEGPVMIWGQVDRNGLLSDASLGLASVGRELADRMGVGSVMIVTTEERMGDVFCSVPTHQVLVLRSDALVPMIMDGHVGAMEMAVGEFAPSILLVSATPEGRELAPRVAARIGVGLTADCTDLEVDDLGILHQTRPAFGGGLMATIVSSTIPQMATVRPGAIVSKVRCSGPLVEVREVELPPNQVAWLDGAIIQEASNLAEARVVIAVGRGIGDRSNLVKFERLAHLMGASLACSRPLADDGWMPRGCQIGQSGITISPRVYMAFGISGSMQHRVGMGSSDIIMAVNIDPQAPMMGLADVAIVADANEMASKMISKLEDRIRHR